MTAVLGLGYIGIEASDARAWHHFLAEMFGIECSDTLQDGTLLFRVDDFERRIIVHEGPKNDVAYIGWQAASAADLANLKSQIETMGVTVHEGTAALCRARNVEELIYFTDPNGLPSEIYYGLPEAKDPFESKLLSGNFVTGECGLGHFAYVANDYQETFNFYTKGLGFLLTDHVKLPGIQKEGMCFTHVNPRHHTVVFGERENFAPVFEKLPELEHKHIHHFLLEVDNPQDVIRAYDRCVIENDVPMLLKIGRHNNDSVFSFYAITPSGFALEFGWGATIVNDQTWEPKVWGPDGGWGHEPGV